MVKLHKKGLISFQIKTVITTFCRVSVFKSLSFIPESFTQLRIYIYIYIYISTVFKLQEYFITNKGQLELYFYFFITKEFLTEYN